MVTRMNIFLTKGCFADVSPAKRSLYLAFVLMATTRTEKIYLACLLFLGCCAVMMIVKRHIPHRTTASGLLAIVFLLSPWERQFTLKNRRLRIT